MNPFAASFQALQQEIADTERRYDRKPGSVRLIAVTKMQPFEHIRAAWDLGQRDFGENYLQEALGKMDTMVNYPAAWHFIGRVQSNKTAAIAARFDWVHAVDRASVARRFSEQRPTGLGPINICIQINVGDEPTKAGVAAADLEQLLSEIHDLPRIRLRGLMALPPPEPDFERQRTQFRTVARLMATVADRYRLDHLSMGTSGDFRAAIAEGATLIRVGAALFGARPPSRG